MTATSNTSGTLQDRIATVLHSPQHAPMNHNPVTGECEECPWPLYMLHVDEIARVLAAEVFDDTSAEKRLAALAENLRKMAALDSPVPADVILDVVQRYSPTIEGTHHE